MELKFNLSGGLRGRIRVPGDKSISHRSVMLAALAEGCSEIEGFLFSSDCLATVRAFRALGIEIEEDGNRLVVHGRGLSGLREPEAILDLGNAGTGVRLLTGILAGQDFYTVLTGDASLCKRPMDRIVDPLRSMGGRIYGRAGGEYLPLTIVGQGSLRPLVYRSPVASAQVKSAILLAGLYVRGRTAVREPASSRDHTERMLSGCGVELERDGLEVSLEGGQALNPLMMCVPGDISSAAFLLAAGLLIPNSQIRVDGVGVNPTRAGMLEVLKGMGAELEVIGRRVVCGEPVADLRVSSSTLEGTTVSGEIIPRLIDELPIIAVLAAAARGETVIRDAAELRVKETDRIAALAAILPRLGARVQELPDGLKITGRCGRPFLGGEFDSRADHRIALSLAVAGLFSRRGVSVERAEYIETSFPNFRELLARLE